MDSSSIDSLLLEDFGQRVDLTRRIREVLVNYPEGTTVLRELIQNADDAGATKVCLCLDRRSHGTNSLLSEKLAQWQGPALLAYNNAVFTEDDFVSISRIGDSKKQGQTWKTGRFGVGFNSVYHLTDIPSFVSGKFVVLFDPQGVYLPNVTAANPGKRLDYVSSSVISIYRDQFFPYCSFGCDMKQPFSGTLFRFPLRNAHQASVSKLSRQVYMEDDISSMFYQLYKEAVFTMLFLKNVLSVEMYIWDVDANEPQKIYSSSVNLPDNDIVWHRQALLRFSKSVKTADEEIDSFSLDFSSESLIESHLEKRVDTFFIVQTMASSSSNIGSFAAAAAKEYDLHLLPWASVAACISNGSTEGDVLKQGRAFCFLPLPVRTGLTVQVNAYFEVSSNRRSIWFGADMDRGGKLRSDWNRLLLEDVVAPAFNKLLLDVQKLLGSSESYYSLWPKGSFEEPWNILVEQIYRNISNTPVFYSDIGGGKWVLPVEAFLHDEEFFQSNELGDALILLGMPIVHLPNTLLDMLSKYAARLRQRVVSPVSVRHFVKGCERMGFLDRCHKLVLLEYCLYDLLDADVGKHANGLALLPLANGEFGVISEVSKGISYFICNELEFQLLCRISDKIIDRDIPPNLFNRLSVVAKSSKANVSLFDVQCFLQLLPLFFSADWKYNDRVLWDPELNATHPTTSWFILFWQYLRDQCDHLSRFGDWPILPSISGHLYRASSYSKLINAESLSDRMKTLLYKIGCKILNPNYGVEHKELVLYVHDANGAGVLDAVFNALSSNEDELQMLFQNFGADEKNELRQFLMDPKWYIGGNLDASHIKNCRKLPIYRVYDRGSSHSYDFSDLEMPKKYLPPLDVLVYFLGGEFINISCSGEEEILLRYYGIERMGKSHFYKENVLSRISELQPEARDTVMLSILHDLPQLCIEDPSFRVSMKKLEFVPTLSGTLKCPQVLYDPRNEELYALLEDSDGFPYGLFQESSVLDMLLGLGLRSSVTPETIIHSARQIESMMHKDPLKAHSRGKVLLSYLEVNATKWSSISLNGERTMNKMFSKVTTAFKSRNFYLESDLEKFWNDLRMICWCPVLVKSPYPTLPWPSVSSMVAPPKLVRLPADMWLVSASLRILDGECSSTALSSSLGWSSPPGGSVIAAQLLELGKNNELVTDRVLRQELALAMPRIYSILAGMIDIDEMDIVKAVLEGCRWVWVGDGFATLDEVVLNGPLHLAPYIRVIPVDLAVFKELFLQLGIREFLKPNDYANILSRMAAKKGSTPLDAEELRAAILVMQHLAEVHFQDRQVQIYLPDVSCRLFPSTDLVYNDAPWLLNSGDNMFENTSTISLNVKRNIHKFVHGNISNDVAEKLGVLSLRRLLLAESADSMNLSLSGVAEAFGQHEALTTRLKHIVEMYADGPGILFELVQNADDAGASEVIFLLDKTQYGTSSVLSPEMADWQGPALYCFNTSVFSPQDLYAISRIGQDSKLDKPFTIGRFGLGFNCVYHFTDIPGFVSGENFVMFDPHACNLPGISPSHPGLRIRFVGRRILEQFPDQFAPFLQFGCDLQHPFPGTLFRFPLRSENAAFRSQIKKEKYAPEDVLSLFSSFSEVVSETLLFLRNVQSISIFIKDGAGHDMQLLHRVCKNGIREPVNEPHPLHAMLDFIHGNNENGMVKDQFFSKLSKTVDRDLPWDCHKVVVTEESMSGKRSHFWIISECIGGGCASSKSIAAVNRSRNFIPWACVAAYLHSINDKDIEELRDDRQTPEGEPSGNILDHVQIHSTASGQHRKEFEGRAFCFLPLPICTQLPTHVNAYFELSSNRRDIWFGNDMAGGGKVRSDWNIFLLEDVVAPAYGRLLEKIAAEIGPSDLFFSFWPSSTRLEPWSSLVRKLYMHIADLGLRVLYTKARGGQWITTKQAIFPDIAFLRADELTKALSDAGLPLVDVSKPIVERFIESCPSLHFLTPQFLRTLLIRRKREFKSKDAMILTLEYCLSDIKGSFPIDSLNGLPLVPLANGLFTTFNRRGEGERIYIACENEYDLLRGSVPHLLVDCGIPGMILNKLRDISQYGDLNICLLSCDSLENLFTRVLPVDWQHAKCVSWTPGLQGQPSLEWMGRLWNYLKTSCNDLSIFTKWPILPVRNDSLLQLVKNSNVIRDDGWSENVSSLLQKVGCFFLRSDLPIDHPQLKNFVQDATAPGILNALLAIAGESQDIGGLFSDASEGEMHELRSFILQSRWFHGDQIDARHIDIIKILPIFESYKDRRLICLTMPVKWLKPEGVHVELLDENFVRTESEREKNILRNYLGVREPSRIEFYKDHVLNRMSEFLSKPPVLSAILLDIKHLIEEDNSMKAVLSQTPFVLASDGSWRHPSRLYDPRVPGLQKLLHTESFFPSDSFSDSETLQTLVILGLKRTLGFPGLLDSARSVSMLHDSGDTQALSYGRKLLACLDAVGFKLSNVSMEVSCRKGSNPILHAKNGGSYDATEHVCSSEIHKNCSELDLELQSCLGDVVYDNLEAEFWSELRNISWCPVYVDPPLNDLPWFISKHQIASPSIVRPKSQMWLVSSTMRILDGECCSQYLQCKLGWMDRPNIGVLSTQLVELSKSYCQHTLQPEEVSFLYSELQREIPSLYSKLQEFIGTDDFMILKSTLDGVLWVWIGDKFVSPKALAFDSPVRFDPYLYAVPSELSEFRVLLSALGVKLTFDAVDYLRVLQQLQQDLKGSSLSPEQLSFVHRVLEAIADCSADRGVSDGFQSSILIPDSSGVLISAMDLVFNDAPWMEKNNLAAKHFVHPSISNDLANQLGVQSLRCLSLVDDELTKDLPCMDYARIQELLAIYGNNDFLLFDLLELADCCKAKKIHLIYDKREHPRQSLLQNNLGEFQGPALTAVLEGATLSREEVCSLQFLPPWRLRDTTLNYGLGLLSCYFVSNLPSVVSGGYFYMFDPHGLALCAPSTHVSSAKVFSLKGTNLVERFHDQFHPMMTNQSISLLSSDSIIIRMPLSSDCMIGLGSAYNKVNQIFERFKEHASTTLLFLKSILQVTLSTWEEGSLQPSQDYSVCVDPSSAVMRNPFSEKKWRKFQISRLFSSSNAAIKSHTVDIHVSQDGSEVIDKWLVVLSLGSGQTRNMALDRKYLAYNLTPVAGVAAHISRNGQPASPHPSSCILSPLPLSGDTSLPVTALGCFLVCHNGGRFLFKNQNRSSSGLQLDVGNQLIEAWNNELTSCIRDSYIEMVLEFQKLKRDPMSSSIEPSSARAVSLILHAYADRIYSFWPRSKQLFLSHKECNAVVSNSSSSEALEADMKCLTEQVIRPFYARLVDLPVWQLYCGNVVKADEGMFLSQSGGVKGDNLPPATVCNFIKEHYPVFSVPWELVTEIQAVGVTVREIKPKMVRDLLKASSTSIVLRSVETYIDVLEYCLCDIHLQQSSNASIGNASREELGFHHENEVHVVGDFNMHRNRTPALNFNMQGPHSAQNPDALEVMTNFGKALFDFGRVVVEDIGRTASHRIAAESSSMHGQQLPSAATELCGLPCPTATKHLARLGVTELWLGSKEQQLLMIPLAAKFIHPMCLERHVLADALSNHTIHRFLKLQSFSPLLLSNHLKLLFNDYWVNHVMDSKAPWVSWDNGRNSTSGGPSAEWIRLFWKSFSTSSTDLSLFSDWPLIPSFLGRPILCRVKDHHLVFMPPITQPTMDNGASVLSNESEMTSSENRTAECEMTHNYLTAFEMIKTRYPWLLSLLNQCNIPVYDISFLDSGVPCNCVPAPGQTLGQVIVSKLLASKRAGYFSRPASFADADRDALFNLFASDFTFSNGFAFKREELDVLRELPIYKTVLGTYTPLHGSDQCIISPNSFFQPYDGRCLSNSVDSHGHLLLRALGVPELHDQEILVKFALPAFEQKNQTEQEDILIYLYMNWQELEQDSVVVTALKETKFVRNGNEQCSELFKPKDLLDPCDSLLTSVFSGERNRFPGERFTSDGWLRILRKAGLRTSLEADMILECASKVELLGHQAIKLIQDPGDFEADFSDSQNEVPLEIWSLAGSVVEAIFANFAVLYGNHFCNQLSKIAFVPAEKGFPSIGGKKGGKRVLSSYSEAILLKDWPLAWSCAPILSKNNYIPPEYSWGAFHLRSPPVFPTVLKHLRVVGRNSGEDTLTHWPTSSGMMTIEEASCEVLKYLDRTWGSLSASDISELRKVAFVPVANGTRLIAANSLFVRLTVNLSPFAFELPTLYLPFVRILKDIGLQDVLSVNCAKNLLLNIQRSCGYQRLNPNELRAVMEVLHFICDEAVHHRSDVPDWTGEVILPDDGCRLVLARLCVYVDTYGSQILKSIDTSRLRFVHPELPEKICLALGIKKLSDVVVEELDHNQQLQVMNQIGSIPLKMVATKLLSRSLQAAVWTVVNSIVDHVPAFEGMTSELVQSSLESIGEKLQFVKRLHTRFLLLPKSLDITRITKESVIPEWGDGSGHRTLYFVDRSKTHVLVAEPPSYMSVFDVIAIVVSQVLGSPTVLPIGPLLSSPENSEKEILSALRLGSSRGDSGHGSGVTRLVGKELFLQDAMQVQFHPLRPFYRGEIVAWRIEKDGEKLKYGRIPEDVRPFAGQALYRLTLETAPGEMQSLLSSQVFSFKSVSTADDASTSALPDSSSINLDEKNHVQALNGAGGGKKVPQKPAKDLQYGRVSSEELVQAVRDMLSAAGINMDSEKQTLLQTTLSLQEQLKESQAVLLLEQEKADIAAKEADAAKAAWTCRVCLSAEVDIAIVPCGHVLCRRCSSAVSRCPFCRLQVSRQMKIFRP